MSDRKSTISLSRLPTQEFINPTSNMKPTIEEKTALAVQKKAFSLAITSPASAQKASDLLHDIKEAKRSLTEKKTAMTRPIMESLKQVKDFFAPYEAYIATADTEVRAKLLAYETSTKVEEEGVDEGDGTEGIQVQNRRVLAIQNELLIPREYLVVDRVKVTKALFAGQKVKGCKLVEEKRLDVV